MKANTTDTKSAPVPMRVAIKYKMGGVEKKHYAACHSDSGIGEIKTILLAHNSNAEYVSHELFKPRLLAPADPVENTPLLPAVAEAEAWLAEIKKLAPLLALIPAVSSKGADIIRDALKERDRQVIGQ